MSCKKIVSPNMFANQLQKDKTELHKELCAKNEEIKKLNLIIFVKLKRKKHRN